MIVVLVLSTDMLALIYLYLYVCSQVATKWPSIIDGYLLSHHNYEYHTSFPAGFVSFASIVSSLDTFFL